MKAGSRLEKDVLERLVAAGYRARSQLDVGYYRIDLVVHDLKGRRLAVECDGDRFRPVERIPEEMARQAALERLGWKFVRVRGSRFYRDADAAMAPLFERLKRLGVEPDLGSEEAEAAPDAAEAEGKEEKQELKDRVIRRALELQDEWKSGKRPAARK